MYKAVWQRKNMESVPMSYIVDHAVCTRLRCSRRASRPLGTDSTMGGSHGMVPLSAQANGLPRGRSDGIGQLEGGWASPGFSCSGFPGRRSDVNLGLMKWPQIVKVGQELRWYRASSQVTLSYLKSLKKIAVLRRLPVTSIRRQK